MATNRNFIVKQGIQVGANATSLSTWSSNSYVSNKNDVLSTPSLSLDFSQGFIDSRIRSLRASSASYLAANGKIVIVGNTVPRIEHHIISKACLGLVCEDQRTNTAAYSDIEGAIGQQPRGMNTAGIVPDQGPTVSADFWIGPNKQSAKHVRGRTGGGDNNVGYAGIITPTVNNTTYTFSVYVYIPATANVTLCNIAFETGTLTLNPNPNVSANLQFRDQWQRLTGTCLVTAGAGGGSYAVPVLRIDPIGAVVYTDCWQTEAGEYASTWIPTTNVTSATRIEDRNVVYPFTSVFNSTAFSLLVEAFPKWTANSLVQNAINPYGFTGAGSRHVWGMDFANGPANQFGGTPYNGYGGQTTVNSSDSIYINSREYANTTVGAATSGTARFFNIIAGYTPYVANTLLRIAYGVTPSSTSMILNGNTATSNFNYSSTVYSNNIFVDRLNIGIGQTGGVPSLAFGGNVRKLSLFPKMLSNNELIALTETQ